MYKKLIFGLLVLISASFVLFKPGNGVFEDFARNYYFQNIKDISVSEYANYYFRYPFFVQEIFTAILQRYPISKDLDYFGFYASVPYLLFKISLYGSYLATFVSLLLAVRTLKIKKAKKKFLDIGLSYFGSGAIMLISLALTHYEIYSAPFFILAYVLFLKGKHLPSSLLYIISIFLDWTLILFAPLFLVIFMKRRKVSRLTKISGLVCYGLIPGILISSFVAFLLIDKSQFIVINFSSKTFSLYWLINQPLGYLANITSRKVEIKIISLMVASVVFLVSYLFTAHITKELIFSKTKYGFMTLLPYLLTLIVLITSLIFTNSLFLPFLALFVIYYLKLLMALLKKRNHSVRIVTGILFLIFLFHLLLSPLAKEGNLLWLVIISLLNYLLYPSKESRLWLVLTNIFVFVNFFIYFGFSGYVPVPGLYFESFKYLIFSLYVLFLVTSVKRLSAGWIK